MVPNTPVIESAPLDSTACGQDTSTQHSWHRRGRPASKKDRKPEGDPNIIESLIPIEAEDVATLEERFESQRAVPVEPRWARLYEREAGSYWNDFYRRNKEKFFKDRHYIQREFMEIDAIDVKQR
jgi:hypothetical protein